MRATASRAAKTITQLTKGPVPTSLPEGPLRLRPLSSAEKAWPHPRLLSEQADVLRLQGFHERMRHNQLNFRPGNREFMVKWVDEFVSWALPAGYRNLKWNVLHDHDERCRVMCFELTNVHGVRERWPQGIRNTDDLEWFRKLRREAIPDPDE